MPTTRSQRPPTAREKLLEAAVKLVRTNGFSATSVDQLCAEAGVTKGAFFHHFASKEALGAALADYWTETTSVLFAQAPYHDHADPLDRVLGYLDFRLEILGGPIEEFSCVAGTMVQEAWYASKAIRLACGESILGHSRVLEGDIAEAIRVHGVRGVDAASLARHIQAVLQGSFILAKTQDQACAAAMARESLLHLRRYFELLFGKEPSHAC
jgi:TetR/AcrR family transcriptional repressor of nem operon